MTEVKVQASNFRGISVRSGKTLRLDWWANWLKCGDHTCTHHTSAERVPLCRFWIIYYCLLIKYMQIIQKVSWPWHDHENHDRFSPIHVNYIENSPKHKKIMQIYTCIMKMFSYMVECIFRQEMGSFFISRLFLAQQLDRGWRGWEDVRPVVCVLPTIFHRASPHQD